MEKWNNRLWICNLIKKRLIQCFPVNLRNFTDLIQLGILNIMFKKNFSSLTIFDASFKIQKEPSTGLIYKFFEKFPNIYSKILLYSLFN